MSPYPPTKYMYQTWTSISTGQVHVSYFTQETNMYDLVPANNLIIPRDSSKSTFTGSCSKCSVVPIYEIRSEPSKYYFLYSSYFFRINNHPRLTDHAFEFYLLVKKKIIIREQWTTPAFQCADPLLRRQSGTQYKAKCWAKDHFFFDFHAQHASLWSVGK